ncbi:MAG: glutamate racemase [Candidatus Gastranaerophilales bacterium]|nr:glutamate racemase [Candidatus Gastranaerophilales bacterium]
MSNRPIGVFDSGVGGLSVFSQLVKLLPDENYIYFGDTINLPYGSKTQDELVEITRKIFDFFKSKNVKAVVMACNTTSALTYEILKPYYDFKIYPIVQTVAKNIATQGYGRIGVFATQGTINSHAYKREFAKYSNAQVFEIACPEWVNIVENELQADEKSVENIKMHLDEMLINNPDKIILGCTHYPYLLGVLSKLTSSDKFINPAKSFAEFIYNDLEENNLLCNKMLHEHKFYVTSNPKQFANASKLFYKVQEITEIKL